MKNVEVPRRIVKVARKKPVSKQFTIKEKTKVEIVKEETTQTMEEVEDTEINELVEGMLFELDLDGVE